MIEWRAVVGYEGFYEVSSDGQVRGLPRTFKSSNRFGAFTKTWPGKTLRPSTSRKTGYRTVQLSRDGEIRALLVHRLVCEAFHGPCPPGMECAHDDGNRQNNCSDNLLWATPLENASHRIAHGTDARGDKAYQHILYAKDIPQIRARRRSGEKIKDLADEFGVHPSTIGHACSGKNWGSVA